MKLLRYGPMGEERPAVIDAEGEIRDLSSVIQDISGDHIGRENLNRLRELDLSALPIVPAGVRLGACVSGVSNFLAVGLNYTDHAAEVGMAVPVDPVVFSKAPSCICGPNDDIEIPDDAAQVDWEVELGIIIGDSAYRVNEQEALSYVAGYCVSNDVSERHYQFNRGGQWLKGKSSPTFGPLGPWLVTVDEIEDTQDLPVWLDVNGQRKQSSSTRNMVFSVPFLVSHLSYFMRLLPGDVIITGTPGGVGFGSKPPTFLRPGDTVRLGIPGLGEQEQRVRSRRAS